MKNIAIIGAGGMGRELRLQMLDNDPSLKIEFFVEDSFVCEISKPIGMLVPENYIVFIAVGEPEIKKRLVSLLPPETEYGVFVHKSAKIFGDDVSFGEGTIVCANCVLTTNISVGKHAIFNRGVQVGHDCVIGDFFSAMPGSIVSVICMIGDLFYLGTNSSIRERIVVVSETTIGLCTGVVKNISDPGVYGGVPAVRIK
jgi:acetyltransferase-like isoleucine patch superfamily enzyme